MLPTNIIIVTVSKLGKLRLDLKQDQNSHKSKTTTAITPIIN